MGTFWVYFLEFFGIPGNAWRQTPASDGAAGVQG